VIQSYRHRFGLAAGDQAVEATEKRLVARPRIMVPTVVLHGGDNGVSPAESSEGHRALFGGPFQRRVIPGVGHNVPQEAPQEFAAAVLSLV
jgi:pimeloyl-ACP methyl ester carboxylesterase